MSKSFKEYYKPDKKRIKTLCQGRIERDVLLKARKLCKTKKIKFQDALEISLKWFIDQMSSL